MLGHNGFVTRDSIVAVVALTDKSPVRSGLQEESNIRMK
jgi:hypothetical protein